MNASKFINFSEQDIMAAIIVAIVISLFVILYITLRNPYKFPYFYHEFDVSRKRNVNIENYIDNFLSNPQNWQKLQKHQLLILTWKEREKQRADASVLPKRRRKQLEKTIDDRYAFHFATTRKQTRYRQRNYIRTSYSVYMTDSEWAVNWAFLEHRYQKLRAIGFETTLNNYAQKSQRSLMTPELKEKIKKRDNFTCRRCGRVMPDGFGLEIDHIIPVSKGGKSIPSNLQVLCYVCNRQKGNKL